MSCDALLANQVPLLFVARFRRPLSLKALRSDSILE